MLLDSLRYCQKEKGLIIFAWCIMSNHIHLIIASDGHNKLSGIIRDFKKFTASQIIKAIQLERGESRRSWMLRIFEQAGKQNSNNVNYQFWRQDNHPIELQSNRFMDQKLDYLHLNPVQAGTVEMPEDYIYSSAKDYAGKKGLLDIEFINWHFKLTISHKSQVCHKSRLPIFQHIEELRQHRGRLATA